MTRRPMRSRRASRFLSLSAVALAAAGLTACGSGKHPATSTGSAPATTTTAALPGTGRPPVAVGDKNTFPEQFVLGALYEQALAAQGFSVSLNRNIGPTDVTISALRSGSVSFYPESIGVWDRNVAGYRRVSVARLSSKAARPAWRAWNRRTGSPRRHSSRFRSASSTRPSTRGRSKPPT
ncbi:MAG: hypothetical protein E6G05_06765 [Actinobacteria bacterium]|nr:MAG: hypothetical protein E6G05_06765 [Actinomycetota bacterium]